MHDTKKGREYDQSNDLIARWVCVFICEWSLVRVWECSALQRCFYQRIRELCSGSRQTTTELRELAATCPTLPHFTLGSFQVWKVSCQSLLAPPPPLQLGPLGLDTGMLCIESYDLAHSFPSPIWVFNRKIFCLISSLKCVNFLLSHLLCESDSGGCKQ